MGYRLVFPMVECTICTKTLIWAFEFDAIEEAPKVGEIVNKCNVYPIDECPDLPGDCDEKGNGTCKGDLRYFGPVTLKVPICIDYYGFVPLAERLFPK